MPVVNFLNLKVIRILTKDYVFTFSLRAARATLGRSASGTLEWKTAEGVQLKHLEL